MADRKSSYGERLGLVALMLVLAGGILWWMQPPRATLSITMGDEPPPAKPVQPHPTAFQGYVGSESCKECHAEIAQRYASHPMANSAHQVAGGDSLEDYTTQVTFEPTRQRRYWVERKGEEVWHHELGIDKDQSVLFDQAAKISLSLGSGQRGRSYLIDHGDQFALSPISWYSQSKRWDLSPGYPAESHQRFQRIAADRCLHCHVSRLNPAQQPHHFARPAVVELGIGCERCHGPGKAHVAHRRQANPSGADPIVNPSKLTPALRDSVCNQCHLQGTFEILRAGHTDYDFHPGMHLGKVWSIFVAGDQVNHKGQTTAVSHVQQMQSSTCGQKSAGNLGCISCHDPHSQPTPAERVDYYRKRCLECHEKRGCLFPEEQRLNGPEGNSCIACHMPPLEANDVPHTTQTDHRIKRRPRQTPPEDQHFDIESMIIFDEKDFQLPEWEKNRARGLFLARSLEIEGKPENAEKALKLLVPVHQTHPEDVVTLDGLGLAHAFQQNPAEAQRFWRLAVERDPHYSPAWISLALNAASRGDLQTALDAQQHYCDENPWEGAAFGRLAELLKNAGRREEAIQAAERAVKLNPTYPQGHEWLAKTYEDAGNPRKAALHERIAEALKRK